MARSVMLKRRWLLRVGLDSGLVAGETAAVETAVACRHSESGHPWTQVARDLIMDQGLDR